jgi:hypothetical protein
VEGDALYEAGNLRGRGSGLWHSVGDSFCHGRDAIRRVVSPHGYHELNFKFKARINRSDAGTIRQALDQLSAKASVRKSG